MRISDMRFPLKLLIFGLPLVILSSIVALADEPDPEQVKNADAVELIRRQVQTKLLFRPRNTDGTILATLSVPAFAEDIGLSDEQRFEIEQVREMVRRANRRHLETLLLRLESVTDPEEARRLWHATRQLQDEQATEAGRLVVDGVLDTDRTIRLRPTEDGRLVMDGTLGEGQVTRLRQIIWQLNGLRSLVEDPVLAEQLDLTEAQQKEIARRYNEARAFANHPPPELSAMGRLSVFEDHDRTLSNQAGQQIRELNQQKFDRVWAVLNDPQRERYRELLGPPAKTTNWQHLIKESFRAGKGMPHP